MTNHTPPGQVPEALRLAEILEGDYCPDWFYEQGVDEVAAELRRLHAENERLAALVEAQQPAPSAAAALPEGWVPLVITHEGQYPEEVAYGPQILMDRLGKWLRKYFDHVVASKAQPAPTPQADSQPAPIDMVLHCPACGLQHIDAPEQIDRRLATIDPPAAWAMDPWKNEPHRSHLCHGCGHIWRPADVPTNGVMAVKTTGKADSPIAARAPADSAAAPAGGAVAESEDVQRARHIAAVAQRWIGDRTHLGALVYLDDLAWALKTLAAAPTPPAQAADSVLEDAVRLLRQILAASQDGDSDTHLSAHFVSRIETITKAGGAA